MTQQQSLIGLFAQTSIHAGTGQNNGIIDLPIQREGHNGWPCIFGSAVKGALRARAESTYPSENGKTHTSVLKVFGGDTAENQHAGALAVSDARLLLLPVRSLNSQFKWVTCPAALKRFKQDSIRFGIKQDFKMPENPKNDQAFVTSGVSTEAIFLEEYRFNIENQDLLGLIDALLPLMNEVESSDLEQQLLIVNNDNFNHLVEHATPVNAHIAIESATKMVKSGALWYQETLPPETLLYIGLSAVNSREPSAEDNIRLPAEAVMGCINDLFKTNTWLQLGGHETVGMGWCAVSFISKED